jgi:hypothetical protein
VEVVVGLGVVVAIAAAIRSTWSPCGQSMLSQITPFSERARGQHYSVTAAFFVLGSAAGGATLGAVTAVAAAAVSAAGIGSDALLGIAAGLAVLTAAVDVGVFTAAPPFFRRQVNEDWLPRYRGWLYGVGFGWQVGVGVATYIMTAGVFLTAALAVLTADPLAAFFVPVVFGIARGLTVYLTAHVCTPAQLQSFHRRFDAWSEPVRRAVIVVWLVAATAAASAIAPLAGIVVGLVSVTAVIIVTVAARRTQAQLSDARAQS